MTELKLILMTVAISMILTLTALTLTASQQPHELWGREPIAMDHSTPLQPRPGTVPIQAY